MSLQPPGAGEPLEPEVSHPQKRIRCKYNRCVRLGMKHALTRLAM